MLARWQKTIVDERGNIIPGAVLTIRRESDQAIVNVYRDRNGTQPYPSGAVAADENGYAFFYVADGLYRITSVKPVIDWRDVTIGSTQNITMAPVQYETEADMRADAGQDEGTVALVWGDDSSSNGYYGWDGSDWIRTAYQPATADQIADRLIYATDKSALPDIGVDGATAWVLDDPDDTNNGLWRWSADIEDWERAPESAQPLTQAETQALLAQYDTLAMLDEQTGADEGAAAWVQADPDPENNGIYVWEGGQWVRRAENTQPLARAALEALPIREILGPQQNVFSIEDDLGGLALYIDEAGRVYAPRLQGYISSDELLEFPIEEQEGVDPAFSIEDEAGAIALSVLPSGEVTISRLRGYATTGQAQALDARIDALETGASGASVGAPSPVYLQGGELVTLDERGQEKQVLDPAPYEISTNVPVSAYQTAATFAWNKPLIGANSAYSVSLLATDTGPIYVPAGRAITRIRIGYGQSNEIGAQGLPLLEPFAQPRYPNAALMLNGTQSGVRLVLDSGGGPGEETVYDPQWTTGFVPLVSTATGTRGVTHFEGNAWMLHDMHLALLGFDIEEVYISAGYGGRYMSQLSRGTIPYQNLLDAVARTVNLKTLEGRVCVVEWVDLVHGESDSIRKTYYDALVTAQANLEEDLQAITGQAAPIPFICSQASTFRTADPNVPVLDRDINGVYAPYRASREHPGKFYLASPYYPLTLRPDYLHLTNEGHAKNGEYMALAAAATVMGTQSHGGLEPTSVIFNGADTVDIQFHVPVAPLVRDDSLAHNPPYTPDAMGFELFDGDGMPVPCTATITGPDTVQVVSTSPLAAGAQRGVGYGLLGYGATKQFGEGPRGQLRDSRATKSNVDGQPLHHWCCHFYEQF